MYSRGSRRRPGGAASPRHRDPPAGRPAARSRRSPCRSRARRRRASSAVIPESELESEVLRAQEGDHFLELVLGRRLDADLLALDRRLRLFELLVLDRLDDRFRLFLRDALGKLDLAPHGVVRRGRGGAELEVLHGHVALDELGLQHVEQGLHLEVVVGDERQHGLGAVERDRGLRALEVVALSHLFGGLIHRVVDLLEVGTGGDVERGYAGHRAVMYPPQTYNRKLSSALALETWRRRARAFSLICLTRSRVIPSREPISSSVMGPWPSSPKYNRRIFASRSLRVASTSSIDSVRACSKISSSGPGLVVSGR